MGNKIDLSGQVFDHWIVIEEAGRSNSGAILWLCQCKCGNEGAVPSDALRSGKSRSCGCYRLVSDEDMIGRRFRRLLVLGRGPNEGDQSTWKCLCDCGNIIYARGANLRSTNTGSCGCGRGVKHGMSHLPEYNTWSDMKSRCLNPNNKSFRYYGGRGIQINQEWIESFESFYRDVGPKPGPEYSLDRVDCNGNYEPDNVKWATPQEQWENRGTRGMTFELYQNKTHETAIYPNDTNYDGVIYCTLGLGSEAAEVCGKVKKIIRDNGSELTAEVKKNIVAEMGDVMWYLSELATCLGVSLETVAKRNLDKLSSRKERGALQGSGDER